jgi:hypothetical protein
MAKKTVPKVGKVKEIPKGLARALAERKQGADSEAMLNDLIEVWGGTRRLALDIHGEFQKAAAGGMTRQRILEMLQRLIMNNTNHEIGRSARPSDMTDEELEAVAIQYMKKVTGDVIQTPLPDPGPDPQEEGTW